ncbi:hypothetical protein CEJ42_21415 [Herbaspirillum robiniae]|uniref:Uncharacterized protein n=1 Tax=Herbaspirillum robiniae TaxID=2014887 RepID=A0A246WN37_9BURK|nr:hypothetical protein CEJ42_21415 [Herbaspirillum robiniae]
MVDARRTTLDPGLRRDDGGGVGVVGFGFFRWSLTAFESPTASSLFSVILTKVRIQRRSAAVEAQRKTLDPGLRRDDGGGVGVVGFGFFRWSLATSASPTAPSLFSVILTKVRIQCRSAAVEAQRKTLDPGLRRDDGGGVGVVGFGFFRWSLTVFASPTAPSLFSVILTKVRIQCRSAAVEAQRTPLDPGLRRDDGGGVGVVGFRFFRWSLTTSASPTAPSLFSVILTKVRIQCRSAVVEAQRKTLDPGFRRDDGGGVGVVGFRFFR